MLNIKDYILIGFLTLTGVQLIAQSSQGGGVWIENGGKIINSLVIDNSAEEGFGVAGGDGILLNCTVSNNRKAKSLREEKIGDLLCSNGDIVKKEDYGNRTIKDAIGVVFWVNSDIYTQKVQMYIVALQETKKSWGPIGRIGQEYSRAMEDTACYKRTNAMLAIGDEMEAAVWCANFQAKGQTKKGLWVFPAGYQMDMLYLNNKVVNEVLLFLKEYHEEVQVIEQELYWCSTESPSLTSDFTKAWIINFKRLEEDDWKEPGTFLGDEVLRKEAHGVRPVMVYYK